MDRSASFGAEGGPVFNEVRAALYSAGKNVPVKNYIYGLGGRDINLDHFKQAVNAIKGLVGKGQPKELIGYLGVREEDE